MRRRYFLLAPFGGAAYCALLAGQSIEETWTYESDEARVDFITERPGVYWPAVEIKNKFDADRILVTAFYRETRVVAGREVELLRSKESIAPYAGLHGAGVILPPRLPAKPEFVRLELLKTVTKIEIGRKP